MTASRGQRGFTLTEALIVIGILGILAGIVFVAVPRYQRGMTKLRYDSYAKEIFVAAQNHLSMAKSEDYLGISDFGAAEGDGAEERYFVVRGGDSFGGGSLLDLMLPFGSVDEDLRTGGRYILRYHKAAAQVLDVFFWEDGEDRFGHTYADGDYAAFQAARADSGALKSYGEDHSVIGYYGGTEAESLERGQPLTPPEIEVINGETLSVIVTDEGNKQNDRAFVKLVVTGTESRQSRAIPLFDGVGTRDGAWTLTLDDIGGDRHFYQRFCQIQRADAPENVLIPGEDIEIQAVVYNNRELTNVAYSVKVVTNSLFAAAVDREDEEGKTWREAKIGYLRHLENLDPRVSGVNTGSVKFLSAEQVRGLDYEAFRSDAFGGGAVSVTDRSGENLSENSLVPVTPPGGFRYYDGKRHSVSGVQVHAGAENAGLFGTLSGTDVRNLRLADFAVSGWNAGALAGAVSGGNIFNVLAVNSGGGSAATVTGSGSVGGLIGAVSGECTVEKCAAALVVESDGGSAGGLIGTAAGGVTVTASYAGGHTEDGKYTDSPNVTASAAAGGLIGDAGAAAVTACYSTCSVSGGAAGGLVGSGSGVYTDCYATGLVTGTTVGAFAGRFSGTASDCGYFEMINERADGENGYAYLGPVGGGEYGGVIAPMDADPDTYNNWFSNTAKAVPYDGDLKTLYPGGYPLRPVATLSGDGGETASCFVSAHYGDWPAPEVIVVNVNVP